MKCVYNNNLKNDEEALKDTNNFTAELQTPWTDGRVETAAAAALGFKSVIITLFYSRRRKTEKERVKTSLQFSTSLSSSLYSHYYTAHPRTKW